MKKEGKEELNRLGRAWCEAGTEEKQALACEIFTLAYRLFPADENESEKCPGAYLGEFFLHDWDKFDASCGSLYSFMESRLKMRGIDIRHRDRGDRRVNDMEQEGKRKWESTLSFDAPLAEDEEETMLDQYADERAEMAVEDAVLYDERAVQFLNLALSLPERLTARAKNETRINYFRMFFTDKLVEILHGNHDSGPFEEHEQELFRGAVKTEFLDYFMTRICRRVPVLRTCPVKPYGVLVEGRPMKHPGHPLPNDVYMTYLNKQEGCAIKSAGTISNQRAAYEHFLRESLC